MSKFLSTAATIVGVAAIAVASAGALAPVATAAALTSVGISASATALATGLGIAAAASSLAAGLLAPKPKSSGNPTTWKADPEAPIPYAIGYTYVGGNIVYRNTWGSQNKNETIITIYSGAGPIQSMDKLYVDNSPRTIDGNNQVNIPDYGFMAAGYQLGKTPETRQLGDLGPPGWTTASKLSGYAGSTITLTYDTKGKNTMTTEPQCGFTVHGVKAYDPRKDSTYPGGSGSHRINNEATWEWSQNPALHALTWLIGRRQNGKLVLGVGLAVAGILMPQLVEAANVADANGWTIGGVVTSTDDKWNVYKQMLQAGGATPVRLGAQVGCIVNTPRVSLATIGVGDVVGDASVQATQARRDRINAIVPRCRFEEQQWQVDAASPVVVDGYVTFDGRQRRQEVEYTLVQCLAGQNPVQAVQLARYDIENAREFGPISLPLKLRWMGYRPGDVVTANLPELGLNGQDILLLNRSLSPADCIVTMTARSETAGKHAFALGQTSIAPPTPSVSGPALVPTPGSGAWAIVAEAISANGTTSPALVIGGAVDSQNIDAVVFEFREYSDNPGFWQAAGAEAPTTTGKVITGIKDGLQYQAAVSYRKGSAAGDRLILGPVIAGQTSVPWQSGVVGPGKPDDNATNSADPNSPFGPDGKTIADIEQAIADTEAAVASIPSDVAARLTTIEAEARQGSPNLLIGGDFPAWPGQWQGAVDRYTVLPGTDRGNVLHHLFQGSAQGDEDVWIDVPFRPNTACSFSYEGTAFGSNVDAEDCRIVGQWLDSGKGNLGFLGNDLRPAAAGWDAGRNSSSVVTSPANTAYLRLTVVSPNSGAGFDLTRIMVQAGAATAWRDDASQTSLTHQVTQLEGDGAAYAQEIDDLTAQVAGTSPSGLKTSIGEVGQEAKAAADQAGAVAQRTDKVEASLRQGSPNLFVDGDIKNGLNSWQGATTRYSVLVGTAKGNVLHHLFSGSTAGDESIWRDLPLDDGSYSLSFEGNAFGAYAAGARLVGLWLKGDGSGAGFMPDAVSGSGWAGRYANAATPRPSNAVALRVIVVSPNSGTGFDLTRIMVQQGEATAWRDDASAYDASTRITQNAQAITDTNHTAGQLSQSVDSRFSGATETPLHALASQAFSTAASVDGRTQSVIKTTAQAGSQIASLDIVAADGSHPFSAIQLNAGYIFLNGQVILNNTALESIAAAGQFTNAATSVQSGSATTSTAGPVVLCQTGGIALKATDFVFLGAQATVSAAYTGQEGTSTHFVTLQRSVNGGGWTDVLTVANGRVQSTQEAQRGDASHGAGNISYRLIATSTFAGQFTVQGGSIAAFRVFSSLG